MQNWTPQEFANLLTLVEEQNDIYCFGKSFFNAGAPVEKDDFFAACMQHFTGEKIQDFINFVNLTSPSAKIVKNVLIQANFAQQMLLSEYIDAQIGNNSLMSEERDFQALTIPHISLIS